ncbi:hypothetical protein HY486_04945 [Candidatus Woesearchaeota archaeon]|nr:hypothetical protein [Candidatus Woesearchaeota archaeon]
MKLLEALKQSIKDLNNKKTVLCMAVDGVLFFLLGYLTLPILNKIIETTIQMLNTILQNKVGIFQQPALQYTTKIIWLYLLLAITIFVLYSLFQGTAWKITAKITKKTALTIKEFTKISTPYLMAFYIIYLGQTYYGLKQTFIQKLTQQPTPNMYAWFYYITTIIIITTAYFGYTKHKHAIKEMLAKSGSITTYILGVIIVYLNLSFIIDNLPPKLTYAIGIPLALLFLAWHRAFFIRITS